MSRAKRWLARHVETAASVNVIKGEGSTEESSGRSRQGAAPLDARGSGGRSPIQSSQSQSPTAEPQQPRAEQPSAAFSLAEQPPAPLQQQEELSGDVTRDELIEAAEIVQQEHGDGLTEGRASPATTSKISACWGTRTPSFPEGAMRLTTQDGATGFDPEA